MAAAEVQEQKIKLKKYKSLKKLKKKHSGDSELLEIKAFAAADATTGEHPLMDVLHKCGYKNVMLIHGATGVGQAGSYRAAYQTQASPDMGTFDVLVQDQQGFMLPKEDENTLRDQSCLNSITLFREKSKEGVLAMSNQLAWEKRGWKVVKKIARAGDQGGMLAARVVKKNELLKDGYFLAQDDNGADYWQLYQDGAPVDGSYSYTPRDCCDVAAGMKCYVTDDQTILDAVALKSGTPYDESTWAELSHDVLGWEVTVQSIVEDSDWPGYNVIVSVQHEEGGAEKTHTVPIRALRKEDDGPTALFMGEVGMWILSAELALFPTGGYADRGQNMQPIVSEFKGLLETLAGQDDLGYMEVVDGEEDGDFYNLNADIQAWCGQAGADWTYDNY